MILKENPMLALGRGPERETCGECCHYVHGFSACLVRIRQNSKGSSSPRKRKPHDRTWPACKFFMMTV
jgi:hypothetical protein